MAMHVAQLGSRNTGGLGQCRGRQPCSGRTQVGDQGVAPVSLMELAPMAWACLIGDHVGPARRVAGTKLPLHKHVHPAGRRRATRCMPSSLLLDHRYTVRHQTPIQPQACLPGVIKQPFKWLHGPGEPEKLKGSMPRPAADRGHDYRHHSASTFAIVQTPKLRGCGGGNNRGFFRRVQRKRVSPRYR